MVANDFFQLAIAKGLAGGILGFDDIVGVTQEAVAGVERDLTRGIVGIRLDPKQQALLSIRSSLPSR